MLGGRPSLPVVDTTQLHGVHGAERRREGGDIARPPAHLAAQAAAMAHNATVDGDQQSVAALPALFQTEFCG